MPAPRTAWLGPWPGPPAGGTYGTRWRHCSRTRSPAPAWPPRTPRGDRAPGGSVLVAGAGRVAAPAQDVDQADQAEAEAADADPGPPAPLTGVQARHQHDDDEGQAECRDAAVDDGD